MFHQKNVIVNPDADVPGPPVRLCRRYQ